LLEDALRGNGIPTLSVRADPPSAGDSRSWLLKPLRGSGGVGIRPYTRRAFFDPRTHYLQEFSPGHCFGVAFVGLPEGRSMLLGITWLIRPDWLHAPSPFHYCGSLLPHPLAPSNLLKIGDLLASKFCLRGLFGVDVVYHTDGATSTSDFRVLEVNPRYVASIEVLERAHRQPFLGLHGDAVEGRRTEWLPSAVTTVFGKAVLYARETCVFPDSGLWTDAMNREDLDPEYADIPYPGELIPRGRPVMTLFGSGPTDLKCLQGLRGNAETLDRCLWG
jgi:predicted ATP-grasp superfamily ATP-dependent carboligase